MNAVHGPVPLRVSPERHDWVNTLVGILDQAFHLTDDEQYFASEYVGKVLDVLCIPDRGDPVALPVPVVLELSAQVYSDQLAASRDNGFARPVRATKNSDIVVSVEAWSEALMKMLAAAYEDLRPEERMMGAKLFSDLLVAVGAPDRAAAFLPDDVVRAARDIDATWW
jgi:hypothetical protein